MQRPFVNKASQLHWNFYEWKSSGDVLVGHPAVIVGNSFEITTLWIIVMMWRAAMLVFHDECIQWREESVCVCLCHQIIPVWIVSPAADTPQSLHFGWVCLCAFSHASPVPPAPGIGSVGQIMQERSCRDWHGLERNVAPFTHSKGAKAAVWV